MACLAGAAIHRPQEQGLSQARQIGRRKTPFGPSEDIFLMEDAEAPYYLLADSSSRRLPITDRFVDSRANLYAMKDLGVQCVMGLTPAGAISHNYNIGDIILVSDLIDRTTCRPSSFFGGAGPGMLRQFPVFCPFLRQAMADCLDAAGQQFHAGSTLVVTEGPRLETPAEIRWLAGAGAELVSHRFVPEAFLAKELELCFAGAAYVANYAETGSRYRPFSPNGLFGGLSADSDADRLAHATDVIGRLAGQVSRYVAGQKRSCQCDRTMREEVDKFSLPADWHEWFVPTEAPLPSKYESIPARAVGEVRPTLGPVSKST